MEAAVTQKSGAERAATSARTIAEAFRLTFAERNDDVAIRTKGDEFTITWGALRDRVDALAGGLAQLGLGRGDTLALMIGNRPEFHICDLAGMMVGAAPFSIYSTYTAEQIAYLLKDAEARIVICEEQYLERIKEAQREVPETRAHDRDRRQAVAGASWCFARSRARTRASTWRPRSHRSSRPTS